MCLFWIIYNGGPLFDLDAWSVFNDSTFNGIRSVGCQEFDSQAAFEWSLSVLLEHILDFPLHTEVYALSVVQVGVARMRNLSNCNIFTPPHTYIYVDDSAFLPTHPTEMFVFLLFQDRMVVPDDGADKRTHDSKRWNWKRNSTLIIIWHDDGA